jgi:hypothetical protein
MVDQFDLFPRSYVQPDILQLMDNLGIAVALPATDLLVSSSFLVLSTCCERRTCNLSGVAVIITDAALCTKMKEERM